MAIDDLRAHEGDSLTGALDEIPNGAWTVEGPRGHRTFQIETQDARASFAAGKRLISLLTGPDNYGDGDWTSFAFVSDDGQRVSVWKSRRGPEGTPSEFETYGNLLTALFVRGERVFNGATYRVFGARACLRCNRRLSTPESIRNGMGPECLSKANKRGGRENG